MEPIIFNSSARVNPTTQQQLLTKWDEEFERDLIEATETIAQNIVKAALNKFHSRPQALERSSDDESATLFEHSWKFWKSPNALFTAKQLCKNSDGSTLKPFQDWFNQAEEIDEKSFKSDYFQRKMERMVPLINNLVKKLLAQVRLQNGNELLLFHVQESSTKTSVYLWSNAGIKESAPSCWSTCCLVLKTLTTERLEERLPLVYSLVSRFGKKEKCD